MSLCCGLCGYVRWHRALCGLPAKVIGVSRHTGGRCRRAAGCVSAYAICHMAHFVNGFVCTQNGFNFYSIYSNSCTGPKLKHRSTVPQLHTRAPRFERPMDPALQQYACCPDSCGSARATRGAPAVLLLMRDGATLGYVSSREGLGAAISASARVNPARKAFEAR